MCAVSLSICASAGAANAGVYGDDLAKCLVAKAKPADQTKLLLWIYSAMSYHPEVRPYSQFTDTRREELAVEAGRLMQRLLTDDCHKETVAGLKYEGQSVIESGFNVLGQVAMRGLMNDPAVTGGMAKLTEGVDPEKLKALGIEAGLAK